MIRKTEAASVEEPEAHVDSVSERMGFLAIILHAHLPFVRHPEHDRSLEEHWLFEAVTECYLPLLALLESWAGDRLPARLTLSLSPTLAAMLLDPLLQQRIARYLDERLELTEQEVLRHHWQAEPRRVAEFYRERLDGLRQRFANARHNLVEQFGLFQQQGLLEIITCSATHAVLPLLANHRPSLASQVGIACGEYERWFGRPTEGFWLPECAYSPELEEPLREAGIRWVLLDTHGAMRAKPRPQHGVFAPILTRHGLAVFGRDPASARQVWSRHAGYPGDPRYREFHKDLGHDADLDYLRPYLPVQDVRTFTGLKYHRVTGGTGDKEWYDRDAAIQAVRAHAAHFFSERARQCASARALMSRPPVVVAPYDAELFGHWWFEGPEFLDAVVRCIGSKDDGLRLITPSGYLAKFRQLQVAEPTPSSWGDGGHLQVWLNASNSWVYPPLRDAQARMTTLARRHVDAQGIIGRALRQAARELLLAQSSDWAFVLTTGTSPDYARARFTRHLAHFDLLHGQITQGVIDENALATLEARNNVFPDLDLSFWRRA
jgi:1,4-alpha-glucan branching enzyme